MKKFAYEKFAYEKFAYEEFAYEKFAYEKFPYEKFANEKFAYEKFAYEKFANEKFANEKFAYEKFCWLVMLCLTCAQVVGCVDDKMCSPQLYGNVHAFCPSQNLPRIMADMIKSKSYLLQRGLPDDRQSCTRYSKVWFDMWDDLIFAPLTPFMAASETSINFAPWQPRRTKTFARKT